MAAVFELPVKVRWRDVDALGHVNHAVFLTYLEEGRDAFYLQTLGSEPHYVVVRLEVNLRAEVRYPDRRGTLRRAAGRPGPTRPPPTETAATPPRAGAAHARRGTRPPGPPDPNPPPL